jgi:hypothetical protein
LIIVMAGAMPLGFLGLIPCCAAFVAQALLALKGRMPAFICKPTFRTPFGKALNAKSLHA